MGLFLLSSVLATGLLAGCGANNSDPVAVMSARMSGVVHGGQSPIQNATVTLYVTSASATGYGQAANAIATATTQSDGTFQLGSAGNTFTCPAGQQVYMTSAGGYPAGSPSLANSSVLMMLAFGDCSTVNFSANTQIVVNEVTTVAAAYALSGFLTTSTSNSLYAANVSAPQYVNASSTPNGGNGATTGSTTSAAGLPHAFLNALNLASISGAANTQTNALTVAGSTVYGTVPQAEINTLADILQSCVNSATGSTACNTLFTDTPSISGVAPANTLQAVVNLARNPYPNAAAMTGSTNLFSLIAGSPAFLPNLTANPPDWAMAVVYKGTPLVAPYYLTLDANDTLFYSASSSANVVGLSPYGVATKAFIAGSGSASRGIAADALGNVWIATNAASVYGYATATGGAPSMTLTATGATYDVAVDKANDVWVSSAVTSGNNVQDFQYNAGSAYTNTFTATVPSTLEPYGLTFDQNQNLWVAPYYSGGTLAVVYPNTNAASASAAPAYSTTAVSATFNNSASKPIGLVIDASGNAWYGITGSNSVTTTGLEEVVPNLTSSVITSLTPKSLIASTTLGAYASQIPGIDGTGVIYLPDNQNSGAEGIHVYSTATLSSSDTSTQVISPSTGYIGCAVVAQTSTTCATASSTKAVYNPRQIVIDSTGSLWAGITTGGVTQMIGLGAPSWPLASLGKPGVEPGLSSVTALP